MLSLASFCLFRKLAEVFRQGWVIFLDIRIAVYMYCTHASTSDYLLILPYQSALSVYIWPALRHAHAVRRWEGMGIAWRDAFFPDPGLTANFSQSSRSSSISCLTGSVSNLNFVGESKLLVGPGDEAGL